MSDRFRIKTEFQLLTFNTLYSFALLFTEETEDKSFLYYACQHLQCMKEKLFAFIMHVNVDITEEKKKLFFFLKEE